eukprot:TRINITY_DN124863_c0_g1_i1.p3 TRINITY_DN124863_c0_g1~~TRINITY_DN124863_c0_g1_i1.p3  ORF type:complete len:102 (-),score=17.98 TRINITY_DN124863_c0_g1_i1:244-549(-)
MPNFSAFLDRKRTLATALPPKTRILPGFDLMSAWTTSPCADRGEIDQSASHSCNAILHQRRPSSPDEWILLTSHRQPKATAALRVDYLTTDDCFARARSTA